MLRTTLAVLAIAGAAATVQAELIAAVTQNQTLITFDSSAPGTLLSASALSGLQPNEIIQGIDYRPATGQIYALGSSSRLYTLNLANGSATQVGAQFSTMLSGSSFGFDFNPMIDRIRVVSDTDQNLVLNPITGAVQAVATNLFYAAGDPNAGVNPNVVHSAYSNNVNGATTTQLYGIDAGLDILVTQANSAGTLNTVGPLGVNIIDMGGFDISSSGVAYLAVRSATLSHTTMYTINLSTGATAPFGEVGGGAILTGMTVFQIPTPATATLGLAGLLAVARRRR